MPVPRPLATALVTGLLVAAPLAVTQAAGGVSERAPLLRLARACNPCNPCKAGRKGCNPCGGKKWAKGYKEKGCNPCAARKMACNPCNPCAAKKK